MEEDIEEGEIIDDSQDIPINMTRIRSYEGVHQSQTWPAPTQQRFISPPHLAVCSYIGYDSDRSRTRRVVDYGHGNRPSFDAKSNRLQNMSFQRFTKPSHEIKSATSRQNLSMPPPVNLNRRARVINLIHDRSARPRFKKSEANRRTKPVQKKTFDSRIEDKTDDVTFEELLLKKELLQQQLQAEVEKEKIKEGTKLIIPSIVKETTDGLVTNAMTGFNNQPDVDELDRYRVKSEFSASEDIKHKLISDGGEREQNDFEDTTDSATINDVRSPLYERDDCDANLRNRLKYLKKRQLTRKKARAQRKGKIANKMTGLHLVPVKINRDVNQDMLAGKSSMMTSSSVDNYTQVPMDVDSNSEISDDISLIKSKSPVTSKMQDTAVTMKAINNGANITTESDNITDSRSKTDFQEDEENIDALRNAVLETMKSKSLIGSLESVAENLKSKSVNNKSESDDNSGMITVTSKPLYRREIVQPVIIPLMDSDSDSDSDFEQEAKQTCKGTSLSGDDKTFQLSLDAVIKKARNATNVTSDKVKIENSAGPEAVLSVGTPEPIKKLDPDKLAEYYKLKAEIARREMEKKSPAEDHLDKKKLLGMTKRSNDDRKNIDGYRKDLLTYRRLEAKIKDEIQELQISLNAKVVKMRKLTKKQIHLENGIKLYEKEINERSMKLEQVQNLSIKSAELIKSLESKQVETTKDTIKGSDHTNIGLELRSVGITSLASENEKRLASLLGIANELASIHWPRKIDVEFDVIQLKLPIYEAIEQSLETLPAFLNMEEFATTAQTYISSIKKYPYKSPLMSFRSYRFSPYIRTQSKLSIMSKSISHKIDPDKIICPFDLQGVCNDDQCKWQHLSTSTLTEQEILTDLASYCPSLTKICPEDGTIDVERTKTFVFEWSQKYKVLTTEEKCLLLINRISEIRKKKIYHVSFHERIWKPVGGSRITEGNPVWNYTEFVRRMLSSSDSICPTLYKNEDLDNQYARYFPVAAFTESSKTVTERSVKDWIDIADLKLKENDLEGCQNILCHGLEAYKESEELWIRYLKIHTKLKRSQDDLSSNQLISLFDRTIKYCSSYNVLWQCLCLSSSYDLKLKVLDDIMNFLKCDTSDKSVRSHRFVESTLYRVQLEILTGRTGAGKLLKTCISRDGENSILPFLVPNDRCFIWLCYIHLQYVKSLPWSIFGTLNGIPGELVCKDCFYIPWQNIMGDIDQESVLKIFQVALKASNHSNKTSRDATTCLPLHINLLYFLYSCNRIDKALQLCWRLLESNEMAIDLWHVYLYLLGAKNLSDVETSFYVNQVFNRAQKAVSEYSKLYYILGKFYFMQKNLSEALRYLRMCAISKCIVNNSSDSSCEILDVHTIYKKLLELPLPYDCRLPDSVIEIKRCNIANDILYIWLCYCLLLEIESVEDQYVCDVFEESIVKTANVENKQELWLEYIYFLTRSLSKCSSVDDYSKHIKDMIKKCWRCVVISCPCSFPTPYRNGLKWDDFRFCNRILSLLIGCLPSSLFMHCMERFLSVMPRNAALIIRLMNESKAVKSHLLDKTVLASLLLKDPECLPVWRIIIASEIRHGRINQARWLYRQATEAIPLSAVLWKEYVQFEELQKNFQAIKHSLEKCKCYGVYLGNTKANHNSWK